MGGFMHLPRSLAALSAALLLAATMPQLTQAREIVGFSDRYSSGTVVVKTSERALYYVLGNGKAMRYPVGVGRAGKQWTGTARISGKYLKPAWSPPEEVKRDKPSLPDVIPGGSPSNPMGAAALTLSGGSTAPTTRARTTPLRPGAMPMPLWRLPSSTVRSANRAARWERGDLRNGSGLDARDGKDYIYFYMLRAAETGGPLGRGAACCLPEEKSKRARLGGLSAFWGWL